MRSILVIAAMAVVAAAAAWLAGAGPWHAACAAIAAVAVTHAVRTLSGDSPAARVGAMLAGQLAIAMTLDRAGADLAGPWLALAATAWAVAELARESKRIPAAVAFVPAIAATLLAPGCSPLCVIVGMHLWRERRPRAESSMVPLPSGAAPRFRSDHVAIPEPLPVAGSGAASGRRSARHAAPVRAPRRIDARWKLAAPVAGVLVVLVAIAAGVARDGMFANLAAHWYAAARAPGDAAAAVTALGDGVGPLVGVAALAGLVALARAPGMSTLAVAAVIAGNVLVDLRSGAPAPLTLGLAAICAGVAVGRFAGTIRLASGQAIAGATCAVMLLVPPIYAILLTR